MSGDNILYEVADRMVTLTVNRPEKLNALNRATVDEMGDAVRRAGREPEADVVIITGAGDKAFVAGADIGELAEQTPLGGRHTSLRGQEVMAALEALHKPVIAAVNGFALGGGLELALACHMRVAAENAALGLPEVGLGLIPGYGGTQRLARLVGRGRALELILTGRRITATEAERIGLVNRIVAEGTALEGARQLAGEILRNGPLAVSFALRAVCEGLESPQAQGLSLEATLFGLVAASEDTGEGLRAFLEKRKPAFRGC